MGKILLYSHNGFSDENANGITMKNLLSAWSAAEKAEFYCDVEPPDFSEAEHYFRVTDMQMLTALAGKKAKHIFSAEAENEADAARGRPEGAEKRPARIPQWLKKRKYNFWLKWLRELLWGISPWGHRALRRWIDDMAPDVVVYMVGESLFMDRLVLKTLKRTSAKLVLYNGEAYRIIDLKSRKGLERAYYRRAERLYQRLNENASLVIFNCVPLMQGYSEMYPTHSKHIVAYNSASCACSEYRSHTPLVISYFGNLGVGRVGSLLQTADALSVVAPELRLDIYGRAAEADKSKLMQHGNICFHGFVPPDALRDIAEGSDILLHVEGFQKELASKLRYAFSTKLAQYLCAGRPLLCYAPEGSTSAEYLKQENGALVVTSRSELQNGLERLIQDPEARAEYASRARRLGMKNHDCKTTAAYVRRAVEAL